MQHPSNHYSNLAHTPYDGSEPLFKIGLNPFASNEWLDVDDKFEQFLAQKKRLQSQIPEKVFQAEDGTQDAQEEVLELVLNYLREQSLELNKQDLTQPALLQAAMMIQEDLVIMRKSVEGWRLVAGSVCFPSSWSLQEKLGKLLHDVHGPVPEFHKGTRNAAMIERIFDNLQVGMPTERFNWSIYNDDVLYHDDRSGEQTSGESVHYLRVERQTLTKLPKSGDILFTIRIYIDPFDALNFRVDKSKIAQGFIDLLNMLTPAQLDYKGLDEGKHILITRLQALVDKA